MIYHLEGFINGSLPLPSAFLDQERFDPNPKFNTWIQYNFMIKSWIHGSVSYGMNDVLVECSTSRQ